MIIKRSHFLIATVVWFGVFLALSLTNNNRFEILNIVGFVSLALLPGLLTLIISKIKGLPLWGYITLAVGFSLLELMIMALLGNTFLPFVGIARPLDKPILLLELYLLIGILAISAWVRAKDITILVKKYLLFDTFKDLALATLPLAFVILSIFGAIHLNDGGSNIFTMVMLGAMGIYIGVLTYYSKQYSENTLPTAIFFMALSLLFMTSLRGWFVTGHDIQQETQFFELTKLSGFWNIAASSDTYNACLSITILPTIFANLLHVPDQYIFKIFFQIFFALCPVIVYLIGRQWLSRRVSFLGAVYCMAFPTFFTDMPFIVRQEVAFLFFGLMLYLIFEPTLELRTRRILFVLMGIGVILSHYSTTYTILLVFALVVILTPLFTWLTRKSSIRFNDPPGEGSKITVLMVVLLLVLSFLWTSTITHTGGQLSLVVSQTAQAVKDGFAGDNRSIDAQSLLSFSSVNPTQELQTYVQTTVQQALATAPAGLYFPVSVSGQYPIVIFNVQLLPTSAFGNFLNSFGIKVTDLSSLFGTLLAKLMEILPPLGLIFVLFKRFSKRKMDMQFYLIAVCSLVFVAANIILPVLSAEYGVFRAMQQSLFLLAFFIVISSDVVGEWFSFLLVILFFLYSTSFVPQLMGNNAPELHLNDAGAYYSNDLTTGAEVSGERWLMSILPPASSPSIDPAQFPDGVDLLPQTEFQAIKRFQSLDGSSPTNDIFPPLIRVNSYVFLGEGTVRDGQASFDFNGNLVGYTYPIQFLDNNKNLIYNNGGARIYQ